MLLFLGNIPVPWIRHVIFSCIHKSSNLLMIMASRWQKPPCCTDRHTVFLNHEASIVTNVEACTCKLPKKHLLLSPWSFPLQHTPLVGDLANQEGYTKLPSGHQYKRCWMMNSIQRRSQSFQHNFKFIQA